MLVIQPQNWRIGGEEMNCFEKKWDAAEYQFSGDIKPSYSFIFFGPDQKEVGRLDFNDPAMTFEGNAEESARVFFNMVAVHFKRRLEEEREAGRQEARPQNTA
jgi:hypothetical protein